MRVLSDVQMATSLLHSPMVKRGYKLSGDSSYEGTNPMTSSKPNYTPGPHLQTLSQWELGLQNMNLGETHKSLEDCCFKNLISDFISLMAKFSIEQVNFDHQDSTS